MRIREIIKSSWRVSIKNKWLWIWGALVASSQGFSFRNFRSVSYQLDSDKLPKSIPEATSQVLGMTTDNIVQAVASIPLAYWVALVLVVILVVLTIATLGLIMRAWSTASLIKGLKFAHNDKSTRLETTSKAGWRKTKSLIFYDLYVLLAIFALFLFFALGIGILVVFSNLLNATEIGLLLFFVLLVVFLVALMAIVFSGTYGQRFVVLKGYSSRDSLINGIRLLRRYPLKTLKLIIANFVITLVSGLITAVAVFVPGALISLPGILNLNLNNMQFGPSMIFFAVGGAVILLLSFTIGTAIAAVTTVITFSNWNLLFKELTKSKTK